MRSGVETGSASKIGDVWNALLLVADQVVEHVDVLRLALFQQPLWSIEVDAGVIHVKVVVAVPPAFRRQVVEALERHREGRRLAGANRHAVLGGEVLEAAGEGERCRARWQVDLEVAVRMEVIVFALSM